MLLRMYLKRYFGAWLADWTGRMSGGISVALTIWATAFPPTLEQARWLLFGAAIGSFILGSYYIWVREHRKLEELTKHKLIFEIDERNTRVRVEQTKSALRIFANIQLWFENMDIHPLSVKEIDISLHRYGIKDVRDAADIFTLFAILRVSSNGVPINKNELEGMMIQERRVTPFYLIEAMLAIEDEQIKTATDLDAVTYIKVTMRSSGYQPEFTAKLFPHWPAALEDKGTSQIFVTGAPSISKNLRRLN
jgi:hypothetical protein